MKIIEKFKTGAAALVLCMIIITLVSTVSHAENKYTYYGCRNSSNYGYRSYTEATGYGSNGTPLNIGVRSYMSKAPTRSVDGNCRVKYGSGNVSVFSGYYGIKLEACHEYCKGKNINTDNFAWMAN